MSKYISPVDIWKNMNISDDFQLNIFSSETINGIIYEKMYINGLKNEFGVIRIFLTLARKSGETNQPLIVYIPDVVPKIDQSALQFWVEKGYACLTYDYYGESEQSRFTIYPDKLSFLNYKNATDDIYLLDDDIENSCWYYYGSIAKSVLKFAKTLDCVDVNKVGVVGYRLGGKFVWQLASYDDEIKVCVSLFDGGWSKYLTDRKINDVDKIEQRESYLIYYSTTTYMQFINKPFLYMGSSNNNYGYMDKICENLNRITQNEEFRFCFSMQQVDTLSYESKLTLSNFIAKYLKDSEEPIMKKPTLNCSVDGNKLLVKIEIDQKVLVKNIKLYYAYDSTNAINRNWQVIEVSNDLTCELDLECRTYLTLIANVTSENNFTFSTPIKIIDASKFPCRIRINANNDRIIYNSFNDLETFTVVNFGDVDFEKTFLTKTPLSLAKGTNDIVGVKANVLKLATFKLGSSRFKPGLDTMLKFDVHSPKSTILIVWLVENMGTLSEKRYYIEHELVGGNIWQKLLLKRENFKTKNGVTLKSWDDVSLMYFESESLSSILFTNLLWV